MQNVTKAQSSIGIDTRIFVMSAFRVQLRVRRILINGLNICLITASHM